MPRLSRLSARKPRRSFYRTVEALGRVGDSFGELDNTVVTSARFALNAASRSLLEDSADTNSCRLRDGAEDVGAVVAERRNRLGEFDRPCRVRCRRRPRRLSAAVLMNSPTGLGPPGVVGCRESVSFSSCWRKSSHSMGTAVRSSGMVGARREFRAAGVGRDELCVGACATGQGGRREDRRLGVGGHRELRVDREGDLRAVGLRVDLVDGADATPRMRTSSPV